MSADLDLPQNSAIDGELQSFLEGLLLNHCRLLKHISLFRLYISIIAEKQKAQVTQQIHEFNEICWDKCVDKPGNKLDGRTEQCLSNCVDRFIDTSLLITNRFAQLLQKSANQMN